MLIDHLPAEIIPAHRLREEEFVRSSEYHRRLHRFYFNEAGEKIASSRKTPAPTDYLSVGQWMIDDHYPGCYGREIELYLLIHPNTLEPSEDPYQGRGQDVETYIGWLADGLKPPPASVVETGRGTLRLLDGHRRWGAARRVGCPLPCWVSPAAPIPGARTSEGELVYTGLTYELALYLARERGEILPPGADEIILRPSELRARIEKIKRTV